MLVNPISFRLSVSTFWNSTWNIYNNVNYKYLFYSDLVFFEFFMFFFRKTLENSLVEYYVSHMRLYRVQDKIVLNIYYHDSQDSLDSQDSQDGESFNSKIYYIKKKKKKKKKFIKKYFEEKQIIKNKKIKIDTYFLVSQAVENILKIMKRSIINKFVEKQLNFRFKFNKNLLQENLKKQLKQYWDTHLNFVIKQNLSNCSFDSKTFLKILLFLKKYYLNLCQNYIQFFLDNIIFLKECKFFRKSNLTSNYIKNDWIIVPKQRNSNINFIYYKWPRVSNKWPNISNNDKNPIIISWEEDSEQYIMGLEVKLFNLWMYFIVFMFYPFLFYIHKSYDSTLVEDCYYFYWKKDSRRENTFTAAELEYFRTEIEYLISCELKFQNHEKIRTQHDALKNIYNNNIEDNIEDNIEEDVEWGYNYENDIVGDSKNKSFNLFLNILQFKLEKNLDKNLKKIFYYKNLKNILPIYILDKNILKLDRTVKLLNNNEELKIVSYKKKEKKKVVLMKKQKIMNKNYISTLNELQILNKIVENMYEQKFFNFNFTEEEILDKKKLKKKKLIKNLPKKNYLKKKINKKKINKKKINKKIWKKKKFSKNRLKKKKLKMKGLKFLIKASKPILNNILSHKKIKKIKNKIYFLKKNIIKRVRILKILIKKELKKIKKKDALKTIIAKKIVLRFLYLKLQNKIFYTNNKMGNKITHNDSMFFTYKLNFLKLKYNKKLLIYNLFFYFLSKFLKEESKNFFLKFLKKLELNIFNITWYAITADIISTYIRASFMNNYNIYETMRPVLADLKQRMKVKKVIGFKIIVSGRFKRAQRATHWWRKDGSLLTGTQTSGVSYSASLHRTKYGVCTISVWLTAGPNGLGHILQQYPIATPFFFYCKKIIY